MHTCHRKMKKKCSQTFAEDYTSFYWSTTGQASNATFRGYKIISRQNVNTLVYDKDNNNNFPGNNF